MILSLELPKELEKKLKEKAANQGISLADYALKVLAEQKPLTPQETLNYWEREGFFGFLPVKGDSAKLARKIRKKAERRSRD